jgi:hypothetical protein
MANRLLLCTKSTQDYNILLSEIQNAKLAYHTYQLPEAIQPRLVLKGIPSNFPEEDVSEELVAQNIQVVRIYQITKMDKSTRTITTRFPIFVITFQPGTDMRKVLQLRKICHCIISGRNLRAPDLFDNVLLFNPLVTLPTSEADLVSVLNVTNSMRRKTARNPSAPLQNVLTAAVIIQPTSQDAPSISNNLISRSRSNINNNARLVARKQLNQHSNINSRNSQHSRHLFLRRYANKHGLRLRPGHLTTRIINPSVR